MKVEDPKKKPKRPELNRNQLEGQLKRVFKKELKNSLLKTLTSI